MGRRAKIACWAKRVVFCPPTMMAQEQALETRVLASRGVRTREIDKQLGCSCCTVRRYLCEAEAWRYGARSASGEARFVQRLSARAHRGCSPALDCGNGMTPRDAKVGLCRRRDAT
ncbi:Transposase (plasmid) [Mycetohabitans rhizoxinica HKI 454]|uniref:Transposase n=1 Tax=Mycetohabitans rhizoxinica (strain DSM 19002 / CIP 109453 / HKI 454) TaxID=882378 RepID=E5ATS1_MYCRK|nr:Transposase [Mycetohabitans rhizoxinica HKI 454]